MDTYEWKDGAFRFANDSNPDLYREQILFTDAKADHYYPHWMIRAAQLGAVHQWLQALIAWKRAEKACILAITRGWKDPDFADPGFAGSAKVNLQEIKSRIAWITKHDHKHPLLYRPYDFNLQVPPYRLGHAQIF